jgi:hypothetical protein
MKKYRIAVFQPFGKNQPSFCVPEQPVSFYKAVYEPHARAGRAKAGYFGDVAHRQTEIDFRDVFRGASMQALALLRQ